MSPAPAPRPRPPQRGSTGPPAPERRGEFPSAQELEDLGAVPAPEAIFAPRVRPVESWELAGPFPDRIGALPRTDESPWGALLEHAARGRAGLALPTEGMHCIAREVGRFYLAHRAQPDEGLKRFITARCHAAVAKVGFAWVNGDVRSHYDEVQIYGHWRDSVMATLQRSLAGGPRTAGIWYGREGDHAVVMVAFGHRELLVEPFSPFVGPEGRFEIAGEVLGGGSRVEGLVNRGRFDVESCETDSTVALPRFRLRCRVDPADASARVSVSLQPPNRVLARAGLDALVWPGAGRDAVYRRARYGEAWPLLDGSRIAVDFVDLLNRVRREADRGPVHLEAGQSDAAAQLAPHFFAAVFGREAPVTADLVVLGMMAGWYVDGIVQNGRFTSAWAMHTTDLSALLGMALEHPPSREALLARDVDRIAVGGLVETAEGHESVAAVVGTYALFSAETHQQLAGRVLDRLERERARRGQRAPERLEDVAPLCHEAASWVQGGEAPSDAMSLLLRRSAELLRRPVAGWLAEVRDIDELEFPEQYLDDPDLAVAVAVSHRQEEGEPWGRYVVLLVLSQPEGRGA